MKLRKILSGTAAFTMAFSFFSGIQVSAEETVTLDQKITDQLYDRNSDGVKDIEDLRTSASLHFDLTGINDLSFLKYAEEVKYLDLENGDIKDLSVISELKKLYSLNLENVPVSDLSFVDNSDLKCLYLKGTEVTDEEKIKHIRLNDVVVPAGHPVSVAVSPAGLLDADVVISDPEIIAFGENGDSDTQKKDSSSLAVAKKEGEAEYSVVIDGKAVKTGKIKVVSPEIQAPPAVAGCIKVKEIKPAYINEKSFVCLTLSDGSLWSYDGKEYTKLDDDVKDYQSMYSSNGNPFYVLHNDGTMTVDGKQIFDDGVNISWMYCSYDYAYAKTDDNALWYVSYSKGNFEAELMTEDCAFLDRQSNVFSTSDGTSYFYRYSGGLVKYELGKLDIKDVYMATYSESYILENDGTLWLLNRRGFGSSMFKEYRKDVTEIGYLYEGDREKYDDVYRTSDGKIYMLPDDKEIADPEKYTIRPETDYSYYRADRKVEYYSADYRNIPELFKNESVDSDYTHMMSRKDDENNVYFSFLDYYGAVSDVDFTYGAESDGNDYIILVVRNDGSLWEYYVGQNRLVRKDFGEQQETEQQPEKEPEKTESWSAADFVRLVKYMNGTEETAAEKYDINSDGVISITDVILLKEKIVSAAEQIS